MVVSQSMMNGELGLSSRNVISDQIEEVKLLSEIFTSASALQCNA